MSTRLAIYNLLWSPYGTRTILVPLEGVCMQLGTLRSRRILHAALARLSLHVDQFVEAWVNMMNIVK